MSAKCSRSKRLRDRHVKFAERESQKTQFFRFAHDRQWIQNNPATRIKLPKVSIRPTMPLTHDEMVKILAAGDRVQITTPIEGRGRLVAVETIKVPKNARRKEERIGLLASTKKSHELALHGVRHRFEAVMRMQLLID
ncbi:MAG: hypothetical protein ACRDHZ_20840, partial [Ktedonobacteraceae bacterium]